MTSSRFGNRGAAATTATPNVGAGRAAVTRTSRYKGAVANKPKDPMPQEGEYVALVTALSRGFNPGTGTDSFKISASIAECVDTLAKQNHKEGDNIFIPFLVSGKGMQAGIGRVKSFAMAVGGFEVEAEYDQADPDAFFIDALEGQANEYSQMWDGANPGVGRYFAMRVTRGKADDSGSYYREYEFSPIPEEHQEVSGLISKV